LASFFSDNRTQIRLSQIQNPTMILLLFVGQESIDGRRFPFVPALIGPRDH
jgi:hypothetical protein